MEFPCQAPSLDILSWNHNPGIDEKHVACHISKHRMLQPPSHHITANWTVTPEETQDGNPIEQDRNRLETQDKCLPTQPSAAAVTSSGAAWGHSGRESIGYWVQRAKVLAKECFLWLLHLPIYRKVLNSLTWVFFEVKWSHLVVSDSLWPRGL